MRRQLREGPEKIAILPQNADRVHELVVLDLHFKIREIAETLKFHFMQNGKLWNSISI